MAIIDPRRTLRTLLLGVTANCDDGSPASILIIYEGGPETYRYLFLDQDYDVVIAVGRHEERESGPGKRIQDVPIRYEMRVPFHASAIDKGNVTAARLLNQVRMSIQMVIETNAQTASYTVYLERGGATNSRMGGFDPLWQDNYIAFFRPME